MEEGDRGAGRSTAAAAVTAVAWLAHFAPQLHGCGAQFAALTGAALLAVAWALHFSKGRQHISWWPYTAGPAVLTCCRHSPQELRLAGGSAAAIKFVPMRAGDAEALPFIFRSQPAGVGMVRTGASLCPLGCAVGTLHACASS